MRRRALATLIALLALPAAAAAEPIPEGPDADELPRSFGAPAAPQPLFALDPPRHPFMAPNGRSNIHDDAYMTDTYQGPGPLGRDMARVSNAQFRECASVTFDSRGRVVTVCVGLDRPQVVLFDPVTLEPLAHFDMPPRQPGPGGIGTGVFTDFSGGGYFYLDERDRVVAPTYTRHIYVIAQTPEPGFRLERDYDLSSVLARDDKIISVLPDWTGRLWVASTKGVVATLDPGTGAVKAHATGEPNGNSFSVDEDGGVYIVTDKALYRFGAGPDGAPVVVWREEYENDGTRKSGQSQAGSGTTPTVMGRHHVAITDNADPINVLVYRRAQAVRGPRLVCRHPVFEKGAGSTDQSLIATDRSIVAENNHGYSGPAATQNGGTTTPGLDRVDLDADGEGCHRVWRSREAAPSVVPKLSLAAGLVYTYTKDKVEGRDDADAWYFTAIDFRTGRTVYKFLAGEGLGYNNNYAPVTLGPDGSAYVGVLGGLVRVADAAPPPFTKARPRLVVHARRLRDRRVRVWLGGRDRRHARRVRYRRLGTARRPPFRIVRRARGVRRVRAVITLWDGSRAVRTARVRRR